ncbi:MAG: hypothetical protein NTV86_18870 [Planctomycetota bacterium]|nr:hypothetical protein [Planctomycetota bacterium]
MTMWTKLVGAATLTCLACLCPSCAQPEANPQPPAAEFPLAGSDAVEPDRIDGLQVGMSLQEVAQRLGGQPMALSLPALCFPAKGGGQYYAVFYDDTSPGRTDDIGLQYILLFRTWGTLEVGQYVFPPQKKGQRYVFPAGATVQP